MVFHRMVRRQRARKRSQALDCPACATHLDAGTIPWHSIVLCSRCCTPLIWDGRFAMVSAEDLAALCDEDRAKLASLVREQRQRLSSLQRTSN